MPLDITVTPYFTREAMPNFYQGTATTYEFMSLSKLAERGISNKTLDSLLTKLPAGAFVAGGFMTSILSGEKKHKDIDIFFISEEAFKQTYDLLKEPPSDKESWAWRGYKIDPEEEKIFKQAPAAFRFVRFTHEKRPTIQLVKMVWFQSGINIIDSFDFTVTQFAAFSDGLLYNPVSFLDLGRKQLHLHKMQFPTSSMRRLIKYTKKGFYAPESTLTAILNEGVKAVEQELPVNVPPPVYPVTPPMPVTITSASGFGTPARGGAY